jgi:hypothetical protein
MQPCCSNAEKLMIMSKAETKRRVRATCLQQLSLSLTFAGTQLLYSALKLTRSFTK